MTAAAQDGNVPAAGTAHGSDHPSLARCSGTAKRTVICGGCAGAILPAVALRAASRTGMIGGDHPRLEPPVPSTWLASPAPRAGLGGGRDAAPGKITLSEAIHLPWSVWIFLTPLLGHGFTLRWLLLTVASYPVFLLLYAKVMVAPRHHAPRYALGLIGMSLVLLPWYPSGLTYFVFGCVLLRVSGRGGWWQYLLQLTGLNLLFCGLALLFQYPWQSLVWIPAVSYIVGLVVNVEALNQQKDAALQLSQDEVRRLAATAERERIGRDLHDLLGHTLSLITLKLELARKLHDRGDARARQEIGEAEDIAREALAQVRSAVTGIRASDLAGELASARLLLECQQVHLQYAPPPAMPVDVERGLALVLREAATNRAPCTGDTGTGGIHAGRTHAGDADPR